MSKLICKTCQQEKEVSEFYPDSRLRSGYKASCRSCLNARSIAWRKEHPDNARLIVNRWRERHPEKVREANRKPRHRTYDPQKGRSRRVKRYAQPGYREKQNRIANERAKSIRSYLNNYKLEHGCIDCGYREHFAALEFDHVQGDKALNVCNAKSIRQAQKEIEKCVVRCANCHGIRTWERLQKEPPQ